MSLKNYCGKLRGHVPHCPLAGDTNNCTPYLLCLACETFRNTSNIHWPKCWVVYKCLQARSYTEASLFFDPLGKYTCQKSASTWTVTQQQPHRPTLNTLLRMYSRSVVSIMYHWKDTISLWGLYLIIWKFRKRANLPLLQSAEADKAFSCPLTRALPLDYAQEKASDPIIGSLYSARHDPASVFEILATALVFTAPSPSEWCWIHYYFLHCSRALHDCVLNVRGASLLDSTTVIAINNNYVTSCQSRNITSISTQDDVSFEGTSTTDRVWVPKWTLF